MVAKNWNLGRKLRTNIVWIKSNIRGNFSNRGILLLAPEQNDMSTIPNYVILKTKTLKKICEHFYVFKAQKRP